MKKENKELSKLMKSYSEDEINRMFDSAVFDGIAKGYMLKALVNTKIERDKVMEIVSELEIIFSEMTASEAREFYINYN